MNIPVEIWIIILKAVVPFDLLLFRASCKEIYQMCKQIRPFGKYFILDQLQCAQYYVANGYTSCLEYSKSLGFNLMDPYLLCCAARLGHISTVEFLLTNGTKIRRDTCVRFHFRSTTNTKNYANAKK
jgi:hypothetical protein